MELGAKSPDVLSDKGGSYWDDLKLSFGSFIDMKFTMKQLNFSTFFFVPKSGKRISILSSCRDKWNKICRHIV